MLKPVFISLFSVLIFFAALAQDKKYVFKDADLDKAEELYDSTVIQAPVEEDYDEEENDTIYIDTSLYYNPLSIATDTITAWKNLKSFSYVKNLDSLLEAQKTKEKTKKKENNTDTNTGESWFSSLLSSSGLQYFFWMMAILFVLFILYKLFLTDGIFVKKPASSKNVIPEAEEEIITGESNFEQLIKQAIQNNNYRLAIRYQYLQTLHLLADKKFIELASDKTNHQYVREITNKNWQNDFAALTLNYEYVWYGEFDIDELVYRRLEAGFNQFNKNL